MARQKSSHHKHHNKKHRKKKYRSSSPANSDSESSGSENNANDVGGSSNGPGGRKNEEELKAENRDAILKRSRMWQTVSSDDDSEDGKGEDGKDEHRQRSRDVGKHYRSSRRDEGGSSGRRRRYSSGRRKGTSDRDSDSDVDKSTRDSNSSSDSSSEESGGDNDGSDSESEDEDEWRRKKRSRGREKKHEEGVMRDQGKSRKSDELDGSSRERKHHKKSRHSSEKKQRNKKEKKKHRERPKEKKSKKKEKKKEKSTSGVKKGTKGVSTTMMGAVDQNAFGKYGVLREADYFSKQREFEVWMTEQKKIPDTGGMAKWETKQYFREYMEDYNTATLPHEKYINLEKWEMAEFHRKKAREMKKRAAGDSQTIKEDEMDMKIKRLKAKEEFNKKYDNIIKASIKGDKRENMQSQDMLKAQMQVAYKQGDMETVKRIEKRLKPDEMEGWR